MYKYFKKGISLVLVFLIAVFGIQFLGGSVGIRKAYAVTPDVVTITVQNSVKDVITEGVGWNVDNVWADENHVDGPIVWNAADWNNYNNLVAWLKPQLIRFGACLPYWSPQYGTYTYNSNWMQNNYNQLDAFKNMDANIIWSNWSTMSQGPYNTWWSEVSRNGGTDPDNDARNDHPYNVANFTEGIADAVAYLRDTKNYTNIKYVSLWNEPSWWYTSPTASYPAVIDGTSTNSFWPMYSSLATALTNKGIRNSVGITGPDVHAVTNFGTNIQTHVQNPSQISIPTEQKFGQVIDNLAVHDYEDFFDYDTKGFDGTSNYISFASQLSSLNSIRSSVNNTYIANSKPTPPFFITEIGNNGYGANYTDDASAIGDIGVYNAEQTIRLLAEGYDGILRWSLPVTSRVWSPWSNAFRPILYNASSGGFIIQGASYYSSAIISRYMTRGSSAYNFSVSGAGNPARVFAAPLKGTDGNWTVFLVNDDFVERQVDIDLTALGIANGTQFNEFEWSAGNPEGIQCRQALTYRGKQFNILLAPRSVMAVTMRGTNEFVAGAMLTPNTTLNGTSYVSNGGFETGSLNGWTVNGNVICENNPTWSNTGTYIATLNTSVVSSELSQTVSGLSPGNYVMRAHIRTASTNTAYAGVRSFDGSKNYSIVINSSDYRTVNIPFTIPAGGSNVTVFVSGAYGGSSSFVNIDDIEIIREMGLFDGGIESGTSNYWTLTGSAVKETPSPQYVHSGSTIATISTSTGEGGFSQTVTGLTPGTYSFTGYIRSGGGAVGKIRVAGYGGSDIIASSANTSWTRSKVIFTIPNGYSSATLYFEAAYTGGASWVNGDDFELRRLVDVPSKYINDQLTDYSKIYSHSSNLTFDTSNVDYLHGDTSRLTRTTSTNEYCIYNSSTDIVRFIAVTFFWPNETQVDFEFYTSPDNSIYTLYTPRKTSEGDFKPSSWTRVNYMGDSLPQGTKYIKVVFKNTSGNYWNPQLGNMLIYYK